MGEHLRRVQRLASLLQQLAEEDGRYGAKSRAARKLGISQGYAWKIVSGERTGVSDEVIQRAADSLGLSLRFFDDDGPDDLDYREYVSVKRDATWERWLAEEGANATAREREAVSAMAKAAEETGERVTPGLLSGLLLTLRMQRASATSGE